MNEWMNEWTNEWMQEGRNEWMNEWIHEWMNECMNDWMTMNGRMNEWMHEWMKEWMNAWMNECMNECMNQKWSAPLVFFTRDFSNLNSRIPDLLRLQLRDDEFAWWCGWHHGDITMMWLTFETGLSLQSCAPFADLIFQKCSKPEFFLTSCAFSRPHLPKMLRTRQFLHVHQVEIELSIQSRDMLSIVQKFSKPDIFFTLLMWNRALTIPVRILSTSPDPWNRALATVLCKFCRPLSPIEPQNPGNRDPPSATSSHFTGNNRRFRARECFQDFSSLNSRIPDLARFPTITYMMMWLPWWLRWWCGCHHGEKASHDNCS